MPFITKLRVEEYDIDSWLLIDDLIYEGRTDRFVAPAGYITDFATSPAAMHGLVNKTGPYTRAAVIHDLLITHYINHPDPDKRVTSRDTDGIFRRIMREEGVSVPKRWLMWTGVRFGALFSRDRKYGRGFLRDLPMITLVSALSVIPLVVVVLPTWIVRMLFRPLSYWK